MCGMRPGEGTHGWLLRGDGGSWGWRLGFGVTPALPGPILQHGALRSVAVPSQPLVCSSAKPAANCPGLWPNFWQMQVLRSPPCSLPPAPSCPQLPGHSQPRAPCPQHFPSQPPSPSSGSFVQRFWPPPALCAPPDFPWDPPSTPNGGHQPGLCSHPISPSPWSPRPPCRPPQPAALQLHTRAAKLTGNPVDANPGLKSRPPRPCQEFELQSQEGSRLRARRPPRSAAPEFGNPL